MYSHDTQLRVRYGETDQMGYVYYGNYASYYEVGRVEAFRALGLPNKQLEDDGIMMPVMEMKCEYLHPGRYDELLTIRVIIKDMPRARVTYHYEVYNEEMKLINKGETTLVFVNMETNRPVRTPKVFLDLLAPYFEG